MTTSYRLSTQADFYQLFDLYKKPRKPGTGDGLGNYFANLMSEGAAILPKLVSRLKVVADGSHPSKLSPARRGFLYKSKVGKNPPG